MDRDDLKKLREIYEDIDASYQAQNPEYYFSGMHALESFIDKLETKLKIQEEENSMDTNSIEYRINNFFNELLCHNMNKDVKKIEITITAEFLKKILAHVGQFKDHFYHSFDATEFNKHFQYEDNIIRGLFLNWPVTVCERLERAGSWKITTYTPAEYTG